jgi:hypothetical protein
MGDAAAGAAGHHAEPGPAVHRAAGNLFRLGRRGLRGGRAERDVQVLVARGDRAVLADQHAAGVEPLAQRRRMGEQPEVHRADFGQAPLVRLARRVAGADAEVLVLEVAVPGFIDPDDRDGGHPVQHDQPVRAHALAAERVPDPLAARVRADRAEVFRGRTQPHAVHRDVQRVPADVAAGLLAGVLVDGVVADRRDDRHRADRHCAGRDRAGRDRVSSRHGGSTGGW